MKSRVLVLITALIGLTALTVACNRRLDSDPLRNYPELANKSVPKTDGPLGDSQSIQDGNNIVIDARDSYMFSEGSKSSYDITVKVIANGEGLEFHAELASGPNGATLERVGAQGRTQTYKLTWTPDLNLLQTESFQPYPAQIKVVIDKFGSDNKSMRENHIALEGQKADREIIMNVVKGGSKPRVTSVNPTNFEVKEGATQNILVTVEDLSASGSRLPKIEISAPGSNREQGRAESLGDKCVMNGKAFTKVVNPQPQIVKDHTFAFSVEFTAPTSAPVQTGKDCKTELPKFPKAYVGFEVTAINSNGVASAPTSVPVTINRNGQPTVTFEKSGQAFQAGVLGVSSLIVDVPSGSVKVDEANLRAQLNKIDGDKHHPKLEKDDHGANTYKISWTPSCDQAIQTKITVKAIGQYASSEEAFELKSDTNTPICADLARAKSSTPVKAKAPVAKTTAPSANVGKGSKK